jgi:hypothetical protein
MACTPVRIPQLAPKTNFDFVTDGQASALDTVPRATGICTWQSYTESYLSFNLEVKNTGNQFTLNPAYCYVIPTPQNRELRSSYAYDPEYLLSDIDASIAQQERSIRRGYGWAAFASIVDLASTISDVSSKKMTDAEKRANQNNRDSQAASIQTRLQLKEIELIALKGSKKEMTEELLRANTLLPGGRTSGQLRFDRMDKATEIKIVCPVATDNLEFTFTQRMR